MPLQRCAYLKNRLLSKSIEWHSRLLLLTSVVFTTLVQWIGALQKNTPNPLGRACSRQEVRCKGTANESPGMIAGSTTGSATEKRVSISREWYSTQKADHLKIKGRQTTAKLTVWSWRAIQSQLHGRLKPVLNNEGRPDSDDFPSAAFHRHGKDHPNRWQRRELGKRPE